MTVKYRVMIGRTDINRMARNAGLGVTGMYEPQVFEVTWEAGTQIDMEKAKAAGEIIENYFSCHNELELSPIEPSIVIESIVL